MTFKACSRCNLELLLEQFNKHVTGADGRLTYCKSCQSLQGKEIYKENREKIKQRSRDAYARKPKKVRILLTKEQIRERKRQSNIKQANAKRLWAQKNKDKVTQNAINQRKLHPEKIKARRAVSNAIRDGKLERKVICEDCSAHSSLQAHHEDYSKPLQIQWLCRRCHITRHLT